MSRKIKFRTWDDKNKVMHNVFSGTPDTVISFIGVPCVINYEKRWLHPLKNFILMQYTGLHDKNGKEIYEGDILSFQNSMISSNDPMPNIRIVKWDEEYSMFVHAYIDGNCRPSGYSWCKKNAEEIFEIIGNIYENPELLEQPLGNNAEPIRKLPEDDWRKDDL